jgi:hypothetical protein
LTTRSFKHSLLRLSLSIRKWKPWPKIRFLLIRLIRLQSNELKISEGGKKQKWKNRDRHMKRNSMVEMEKVSAKILVIFVGIAIKNTNSKLPHAENAIGSQWLSSKGKSSYKSWFRITSIIKKADNRKDTNGRCSRKLKQLYGKNLQLTTIKNGNISLRTQSNNLKNSQSCQRMIQISKLWRWISNRERNDAKKIHKMLKD